MKTYTWKEAFEDAYKAAMAGSTRSQNFVGYCYDIGRGVGRNQKMARQWYEKAARKGNIAAIFNLAVMHDKGQGGKRNARRAGRTGGSPLVEASC
jgi:TPR repeat protein